MGVKALFIADTDNDGDNELVVGASGASDPKGYIYIFDFRNGRYQEVWKYYVGEYLRHSSIYVGDADNDGENEIVVGVSWYGRYAMLIEHTYGDNYRVDWKTFYYYDVMCPYIGDADNDGYNELILASSTWDDSKIAIGDYTNKNFLEDYCYTDVDPLSGMLSISVGDVNGDYKNEIIVAHSGANWAEEKEHYSELTIFEHSSDKTYKKLCDKRIDYWTYENADSAIGDIDNDGKNEIAIVTSDALWIYKYNNSKYILTWSCTGVNTVFIGDSDNDGLKELILAGKDGVKIYKSTQISKNLKITITTNKKEYTTGDIMLVNITIENLSNRIQNVVFKWWITVPAEKIDTEPLMSIPMTFPPNYKGYFNYPITVGYWSSKTFGAVFCVTLIDQKTGKIVDFDSTFWNYNPSNTTIGKGAGNFVSEIKKSLQE